MRDVLSEIVAKKKITLAEQKTKKSLEEVKAAATVGSFKMTSAVKRGGWSLIAECKLQSPVKGRLQKSHSVTELAKIYAAAGATMLSVHTDEHFLGRNEDIVSVRELVDIPILRKDFIIDEYQIYEARCLGADAVLLIARILTADELKKFLATARNLGLNALVEVHDEDDMEKISDADIEFLGINNRNLHTFETSVNNTLELLPHAKKHDAVLISESGVFTAEDAAKLREVGCDGILVGEGLVRADDIATKVRELMLK